MRRVRDLSARRERYGRCPRWSADALAVAPTVALGLGLGLALTCQHGLKHSVGTADKLEASLRLRFRLRAAAALAGLVRVRVRVRVGVRVRDRVGVRRVRVGVVRVGALSGCHCSAALR